MITHSADLLRSYVNGRYFLKQLVRTADDVSLFLALDSDDARVYVHLTDRQLGSRFAWSQAAELSEQFPHPHLLAYLDAGQALLEGQEYSYLVSEPIDDFVEDVLAERTLTADETESVLRSVLSALAHLHEHGYTHTDLRPSAVVAANGVIKLRTETLKQSASAEDTEARRARAGDLLAAGELATLLSSGQTGPAAVLLLPPKLASFVRATAGTSECPSPTARQLLAFLDGEPLASPPPPPAPRANALHESVPVPAASVVPAADSMPRQEHRAEARELLPTGRRMRSAAIVILAVLAFSLIVLLSRRAGKVNPPVAQATVPAATTSSPPRQSSAPAAKAPAAKAPAHQNKWAVIAATYASYDAAEKRAAQINAAQHRVAASVLPHRGEGARYYVVLGTASSSKEAARIKARATGAGTPRDTYVTRLQF